MDESSYFELSAPAVAKSDVRTVVKGQDSQDYFVVEHRDHLAYLA